MLYGASFGRTKVYHLLFSSASPHLNDDFVCLRAQQKRVRDRSLDVAIVNRSDRIDGVDAASPMNRIELSIMKSYTNKNIKKKYFHESSP